MSAFQVGFSRIVITPQESVPLAGYFNSSHRMSQAVLEDLCATCIAMTDGTGETILMLATDTTRSYSELLPHALKHIHDATGIPENRITISGSHTHSGPDLSNLAEPSITRYYEYLLPKLQQVAQEALADRKPATLYTGSIVTERMNFVRHYKQVAADGSVTYFHSGLGGITEIDDTIRHTTEADPTMYLAQFVREGGKDVVLVNFRAHATMTGGGSKYDMSADFIAPFRDVLEAQANCHALYLQGGSGNTAPSSRLPGKSYTKDYKVYGARLAYFAVKGLEHNMRQTPTGPIRVDKYVHAGKVNKADNYRLEVCRQIKKIWDETGDRTLFSDLAKANDIKSPYHALSIVDRAERAGDIPLELNAIAIGEEFAFAGAPNELFDTNTAYVQAHSPFATTFVLDHTNGYEDYLPSRFCYEYTSYETDSSRFCPGIGEEVQDHMLRMLNQLKQTQ